MKTIYHHTIRLAFGACMILTALAGNAQSTNDYFKAAEDFFSKGDYYSAAQYYERVLSGKVDTAGAQFNPYSVSRPVSKAKAPTGATRNKIVYKIAESYRMLNYPAKSEQYYQEAVKFSEFPLARFYYAKSLKANAKFDEAAREFNQFLAESADEQAKADAQKELKNLAFISEQMKKRDLKYYHVNKMGGGVNPHGANYAPALVDKSTFVFTSTRKDTADKKAPYINRLYAATVEDNGANVQLLNIDQSNSYHQGVSTLSPDGNTMYLTKWNVKTNEKNAQVYVSTKNGSKWSDPVLVTGDINAAGYSSQQPSVSPDGKYLFYASNKPGGNGGFDIWMAPIENGSLGASVNLGTTVNTSDDEQAPYYYAQGKSLIFSSNGRIGMGGFDFFQAKGTPGAWQNPENLGYPVNSIKDDMYLVSTGEKSITDNIYLSSDRSSACCLELFSLNKVRPKRTIFGTIVDCEDNRPLGNVTVKFMDGKGTILSTSVTGADGKYQLVLDEYQPVTAVVSADGYESKELKFNAPADDFDETMTNPALCLNKIPPPVELNKPIVLENVYYDFDKATLKPESFPSLDSLVSLLNFYPKMVIEVSAHTDNKGSDKYNMTLSEKRAQSVVNYLIEKGIEAARLQAKGYGETMPIAPNDVNGKDNPEGRAKNRRTEFKVLSN